MPTDANQAFRGAGDVCSRNLPVGHVLHLLLRLGRLLAHLFYEAVVVGSGLVQDRSFLKFVGA